MVSIASSKTAGSTQPPLTDPTTCPSSETAIDVPGPSGPDLSTFTTVARAAFFPSSLQLATLSMTGFNECLLSIGSISARSSFASVCQHFSLSGLTTGEDSSCVGAPLVFSQAHERLTTLQVADKPPLGGVLTG